MTGLRPHTKSYDQAARDALGLAFVRAREAAGYASRPVFAQASGVGKTSLYKLETGLPVSASVYEAAARAIPNWTEDTPKSILDGNPAPPTVADAPRIQEPASVAEPVPSAPSEEELPESDKVRLQVWKDMIKADTLTPELRLALLQHLFESAGSELTPERLEMWLRDPARLQAVQEASERDPSQ